ncbi:RDD family protein [Gammaproteobacteria bacterium]|nr:RDD family protein [Gammaproteobacteria bacterium]
MSNSDTEINAGLMRRLLALLYDSILIIGIYMSYVILVTYLNGSALESQLEILFLQFSFIIFIFLFYCYFWKFNNGQTLGMQVWKIKLVSSGNEEININKMVLRCALSMTFSLVFLSNFIFIIFNKERKTLGDYFSKTKLLKVY